MRWRAWGFSFREFAFYEFVGLSRLRADQAPEPRKGSDERFPRPTRRRNPGPRDRCTGPFAIDDGKRWTQTLQPHHSTVPDSAAPPSAGVVAPSFRESLRFWLKLGCISFGGPAGQIALMHEEIVARRGWIDEPRFMHGLNFCMLLPGPEAQQLATYLGWRLHGVRGGLAAGILFVLPSALLLWALSWLYAVHGRVPAVAAVLWGLKAAVVAVVLAALLRMGQKALTTPIRWGLAVMAFAALLFLRVPFPAVILTAALIGFLVDAPNSPSVESFPEPTGPTPTARRVLRTLLLGLGLWWTPTLLAGLALGWDGTLFQLGWFFSKAATITFGGAYAVLPYVGQQAVDIYGWLGPSQMVDGLGLAETTPGPLIMVLQFVGFLAGWNHPGALPPLLAATLGAALTTWATFAPCFLWIFLGAPHLERLRRLPRLNAALGAVTAAVVGVIASLAVWFAGQVILPPSGAADWPALALATAAFAALRRDFGVVPVMVGGAFLGWIWRAWMLGATG